MNIKLLSRSELEALIDHAEDLDDSELLHLCTIVEPIQIVDLIVKRRVSMDWSGFQEGWQKLLQNGLSVAPLDQDCLNRALFERSTAYAVSGLWAEACDRIRCTTPDQSIHRLILRSSEQTWWGDECYNQMETWYEGNRSR